jgi:hypothetical protein
MNTEEARVKTGGGERGAKPAGDRDLPRRSVEILRDLGLSAEKIVAYHRRFPTPTPTSCREPTAGVDNSSHYRQRHGALLSGSIARDRASGVDRFD